jgi:hypothetical protein
MSPIANPFVAEFLSGDHEKSRAVAFRGWVAGNLLGWKIVV